MTSLTPLLKRSETAVAAILIAAMVLIGLVNPAFWQLDNLFNLLRANVVIGIMALSVLMVMISGGIDVSFPAFAAAGMYLTVIAMNHLGYQGVVLPFVGATLIGLVCGLVNAAFIHTFRMIPLIVTLGTASVVRGLLLGLVGTSIINIDRMPQSLIAFGRTTVGIGGSQLTAMIFVYLGLAVVVWLFLTRTMLGRGLFAYGGDPESAKRVGFDNRRIVLRRLRSCRGSRRLCRPPSCVDDLARQSARLRRLRARRHRGGRSRRRVHLRRARFGARHLLGVFMLVLIKNSLIILRVDNTWQGVVVGAVIVAATALTAWRDRKKLN